MKNAIFLITLVVSALTFSSCNNDDDSPDQLIGKWKLVQEFENDVEYQLDCEDQIILEFKADASFAVEYFNLDNNDNCVSEGVMEIGTWENKSNNSYGITSQGGTETVELLFVNDTFSIVYLEGEDTYKEVYQRQ